MSKQSVREDEERRRFGSKNGSSRGGRDDSNASRHEVFEMDFYADVAGVNKLLAREGLVCSLKQPGHLDEATFQLNRDGAFFVGKSM